MWTVEQCAKLQLASLEAAVGLANKAFEGFERVMELNLQTSKTTLEQTREGIRKTLSAQGPQELVELPIHLLQPVFDNSLTYRRQLQDIIAATQAEFAKVAEVQYATSKGQLQDFIDSAVHNAPSGSASPLGAWQEAIKATTTLYESMQLTAKQAAEVVESHLNTAAETASQSVRRRAVQASQAAVR